MNKQDTAAYLVSLIALVESQEDAGIARSQTLTDEYNRVWDQLKELIRKDNEGNNDNDAKAGANLPRYQPSGGGAAGGNGGSSEGGRDNGLRKRV